MQWMLSRFTIKKAELIGKGQIYYSSKNLQMVKGLPGEKTKNFSINKRAEVIHRNNWVSLPEE